MKLGFETDDGIGTKATFGAIVLEADETLEPELSQLLHQPGGAIYHNRIRMAPHVTEETLMQMQAELPGVAAQFPARPFDVIGYGCTSAATVIGPDAVRKAIQSTRPEAKVTDPLTAILAACEVLGVRKIGFLTPYLPAVSARMQARLEEAGYVIVSFGSFEESDDRVVARITPAAIFAGIEAVAAQAPCDAVIVACTNLRVAGVAAEAEKRVGVPVISSNLALAWHMLRLAGITPAKAEFGRLMAG